MFVPERLALTRPTVAWQKILCGFVEQQGMCPLE